MNAKAIIIVNRNAHSGTTSEQHEAIRDVLSSQLKDRLHLESIEWCQTDFPGHGTVLTPCFRDWGRSWCSTT